MRPCPLTAGHCCLLGLAVATAAQRVAGGQGLGAAGGRLSDRDAEGTDAALTGAVLNPLPLGQARRDTVGAGTKLCILCVGDSIALGTLIDTDGGDGNGYRLRLRDDLSADGVDVSYVGRVTARNGNMSGSYFAAWPGRTIQSIAGRIELSLRQRPNVILVHAGTNDMSPRPGTATEGNDPAQAVDRLGALVDGMLALCPDAVILVAMIIGTCEQAQAPGTREFQGLIPGMVQRRFDAGHRVLAANLTSFPTAELRDCIHPTNERYRRLGDLWYDLLTQVPRHWIQKPEGAAQKPRDDEKQPPLDESAAVTRRPGARLTTMLCLAAALRMPMW